MAWLLHASFAVGTHVVDQDSKISAEGDGRAEDLPQQTKSKPQQTLRLPHSHSENDTDWAMAIEDLHSYVSLSTNGDKRWPIHYMTVSEEEQNRKSSLKRSNTIRIHEKVDTEHMRADSKIWRPWALSTPTWSCLDCWIFHGRTPAAENNHNCSCLT